MSIQSVAIENFGKLIVSSKVFYDTKEVIGKYVNTILTGPQKRVNVVKELADMGHDIGTWRVNLAIELAVAYYKLLIK
jgi:hypothetical protein